MSRTAIINFKTDPALKKRAIKAAEKLGISLSMVLNNELRRFAAEQRVLFEVPEVPNAQTARHLAESREQIEAGDYHQFDSNEEALKFLRDQLK